MIISNKIKNTAFRSLAVLGLFFFIACEKDNTSTGVKPEQSIEKKLLKDAVKNLEFIIPQEFATRYSAPTSFNFSSSGNGVVYSNGGGSYTYAVSGEGFNYTSTLNLSIGGSGSATIGGKSANFDYVICGDLFIEFSEDGEQGEDANFTIFIGINGDFTSPDEAEVTQILEFIAYQENLDGSIDLGNVEDYNSTLEDGEFGFVFYIDASDADDNVDALGADPFSAEGGVKAYLSTGGTANVSSGSLSFDNIDMVEILNGSEGNETVKASGQLICN